MYYSLLLFFAFYWWISVNNTHPVSFCSCNICITSTQKHHHRFLVLPCPKCTLRKEKHDIHPRGKYQSSSNLWDFQHWPLQVHHHPCLPKISLRCFWSCKENCLWRKQISLTHQHQGYCTSFGSVMLHTQPQIRLSICRFLQVGRANLTFFIDKDAAHRCLSLQHLWLLSSVQFSSNI